MTQMSYNVTMLPKKDIKRITRFLKRLKVEHRINEFSEQKELVIRDDEMAGFLRSFERMLGVRAL